jgi:hypothetical protein
MNGRSESPLQTLRERVERATGIHEKLGACHPKLARGQVWCTVCGATQMVNAAGALAHGWPLCCGYTMTIDSPDERACLNALAEMGLGE